jgi:hypothetical protein
MNARDFASTDVVFRTLRLRRRSDFRFFHGSMACLHVPLSTLRVKPCDCPGMTRSRCGSLRHHRMALSSTPPRRTIPAHLKANHNAVRTLEGRDAEMPTRSSSFAKLTLLSQSFASLVASKQKNSGAEEEMKTASQTPDARLSQGKRQPRRSQRARRQALGRSNVALARAFQYRQGPDSPGDDHVVRHAQESRGQREPCGEAAGRHPLQIDRTNL